MTLREPHLLIRDMIDHAQEAIDMLGERSLDEMVANRAMTLALTRLVEVVGEAARQIPPEHREPIDDVPWHQVIGMRHRLVHAYRDIDTRILWQTITEELPPLIATLRPHSNQDSE